MALLLLPLLPAPCDAGEEDAESTISELAQRLSSDDLSIRRQAAWDLWQRRKEAGPAAAALAAATRDEDEYVRNTAARAVQGLLRHAPDAVAELAAGLADDRVEVRRLAAELLPYCYMHILAVRSALIVALTDDPDDEVRAQAANALRMLPRAEAGPAGPALVKALEDPSPEVRGQAVYALGWLGRPEALATAIRLLDDASALVRIRALQTLQHRQDLPTSLAETAARLLQHDPDAEVRRRAAFLACRFPDRHEVLVPALLAALGSDEYPNRTAAAVALAAMGPVDPAIPPALASALGVGYDSLTAAAANGLLKMGPVARMYLPDMAQALPGMMDENCRNVVVSAIRQVLEPVIDETVGALENYAAVVHDSANLRAAAALVRLRGRDPRSLTRLVDGLREDRNAGSAMHFLAELGPLAWPAIPLLEEMAGEGDAGAVRADLVLARLGKDGAEAALERLLAVLGDPCDPRRLQAVQGLIWYLPPSPATVAPLRAILEDDGPANLRAAAAQALRTAGPAAREALPALRAAAKDRDPGVAASARSAIDRITGTDTPSNSATRGGSADPAGD